MAVAFKTALGNNGTNASATTITVTTTAAIAVDDLVVVRWATDAGQGTVTCSDGSNTYTSQTTNTSGTTTTGCSGGIFTSKATVAKAAGTVITLTMTAVIAKAVYIESFTGVENTLRGTATTANGTGAPTAVVSATASAGDLVICSLANESRAAVTGDNDTTNGNWSTVVQRTGGGTSGNDNTSVQVNGQYKIVNASGTQSWLVTGAAAVDHARMAIVLQASPEPTITQAAYQFFDDAGTESGAASLAALNTAVTGNLNNGDGYGVLRIRLQSTTAVAVPSFEDWQLQYEKNTSGTWVNVTGSSADVQSFNNTNLTDAAATTNRLGAGTGSFVAGKISETGVVTDLGWTANNFTELVYSLKILAVGLTTGDALRFRVLRSGVTTNMTYTQTPLLNITRAEAAVTQAAYRFYGDGTETGSTALAAQNTAPTVDVSSADVNAQLRVLLQSTNIAALLPPDDWQLQVEVNNSGTWVTIATDTPVQGYDSSNLTEGAATTNRLTGGAGTFVAGKVAEDGLADDVGWTANNFTELLFSIKVKGPP